MVKKVSIIGAGAWGTALGLAVARAGCKVTLWSIDAQSIDSINKNHQNPFLPGIKIPKEITATTDLKQAIKADVLLLVVPSQVMTNVCSNISDLGLKGDTPLVICNKGIENGSLRLMSEVVQEYLPQNPIAVISGPNFADEVAKNFPSAATLACADSRLGQYLVDLLGSETFRTYLSDDIIGAQIGGAVKNVIAIACGASDGMGFGVNTKSMLVTRGIAELMRLTIAKGGKEKTLHGLCGVGDMMLTCGSSKSRNMSLGFALGGGRKLKDVLAEGKTVEGYHSSKSVTDLAKKLGVDMPICNAVKAVLHDGVTIKDAVATLLKRPLAVELD